MSPLVMYGLYDNRPTSKRYGEIFYVGIGSPKRMMSHFRLLRCRKHRNSGMQKIFDKHVECRTEPIGKTLAVLPNRDYANFVEKRAIEVFGRRCEGRGNLCNIARGGDGPDPSLMTHPEIISKIQQASLKRWQDPRYRKKRQRALVSALKRPGVRDKVSIATRKALRSAEVRKRHLQALKRVNAAMTTEQRSLVQKISYAANPERREKSRCTAKELNSRPEVIEAKRIASRAANYRTWADPIIRARRIAGMLGKSKTLTPAALNARRINLKKAHVARRVQTC